MAEKKDDKKSTPTPEQVAEWILRDIQMCMSFMNMVRSDPAVLKALATAVHGRYVDQLQEKDTQPELEFSENGNTK